MFRFFRKIRSAALFENRLTRYFLYALGEIALVVIGILIALQVDNWNEERKERREELDEAFYGFIIGEDGSFTERKNTGWCGTPPITYGNFEGSWTAVSDSLLDIVVFGRIAGKSAAESLSGFEEGALSLDHVRKYNKEIEEAGVADGRVSPMLLPDYTNPKVRERQLTTGYVGNMR